VPVKLRIENLKVVVVRDAGRRHLIELEAVRRVACCTQLTMQCERRCTADMTASGETG
jgi:hypothetical protein